MIVEIDNQSTENVMKALDRVARFVMALAIVSVPGLFAQDAADGLQIYWVDVEGTRQVVDLRGPRAYAVVTLGPYFVQPMSWRHCRRI